MTEDEWLQYLHRIVSPTHGIQTTISRAIGTVIEWLAKHQKKRSRWSYVTSSSGGVGAGVDISLGIQCGTVELEAPASDGSKASIKLAVDYGWLMAGVGYGVKVKKVGVGAGGSSPKMESHGALFQHDGESDFEPSDFDGFCCGLYGEAVAVDGIYLAAMLLGVSAEIQSALKNYDWHRALVLEALREHTLNPIRSLKNLYHATEHYLKMLEAMGTITYLVMLPKGPFRGVLLMNGDTLGLPSASASVVLGSTKHRML